MTRFELATPATRTRCATRLRYIPTLFNFSWLLTFNGSTFCACNGFAISAQTFALSSQSARKTCVLLRCATPLTNRYLIDLFGRVLHPDDLFKLDAPASAKLEKIGTTGFEPATSTTPR